MDSIFAVMLPTRSSLPLVLLLSAVVVFGACQQRQEADVEETGTRAGEDTADIQIEDEDVTDTSLDTEAGAAGAGTIAEPEIIVVVHTINDGEIEVAELALTKATNPEVRSFAQKLADDHKELDQQLNAGGGGSSALSAQLQSEAQTTKERLESASGEDFDRQYVDSQVTMHQRALAVIQNQLLPSAQDSETRSKLEKAEAGVEDHLKQAQQLQQDLTA